MDEIDDIQVEEEGRWSLDREQNIGSDMEEDSEDEVEGEDENLLDKTNGGRGTGYENLTIAKPSEDPPRFCSLKWIVVHVVLLILFLLLVGTVVALYLEPKQKETKVLIHRRDNVILPLNFSPSWLTKLTVTTNGSCPSGLYKLPCDQLHINYTYHYNPSSESDYVYCLDNSTFIFTLLSTAKKTIAYGFVANNIFLKNEYHQNDELKCNDSLPAGIYCVNVTKDNPTNTVSIKLPTYVGQYFFPWKGDSYMKIRVNRYDYSYNKTYEQYYQGHISDEESVTVKFHDGFGPTNFDKFQQCLLLNVSKKCLNGGDYYYAFLTPEKRYDILFWPGLVFVLVLCLEICLLVSQYLYQKAQKKKWHEASTRDMPVTQMT